MSGPFDFGINSVTFEMDESSRIKSQEFGDPSVLKLGKFWFRYGEYNGYLRFVNFAKCIWFPEAHGATGYGWLLDPSVTGFFHVLYNELPSLPLTNAAGNINLGTGDVSGLSQIGDPNWAVVKPATVKLYDSKSHRLWSNSR